MCWNWNSQVRTELNSMTWAKTQNIPTLTQPLSLSLSPFSHTHTDTKLEVGYSGCEWRERKARERGQECGSMGVWERGRRLRSTSCVRREESINYETGMRVSEIINMHTYTYTCIPLHAWTSWTAGKTKNASLKMRGINRLWVLSAQILLFMNIVKIHTSYTGWILNLPWEYF